MTALAFRTRAAPRIAFGVSAFIATAAHAQSPAAPAIPALTLATVQATIDFCSRLDAAHAEDLQTRKNMLLNGAAEDDLAAVRASPEYRAGYETASSTLKQMSKDEAAHTCKSLLQNAP